MARARTNKRSGKEDFQAELEAWKKGAKDYAYRLPTRGLLTARKIATYDVGKAAKQVYRSSAGKELRELGSSVVNAVVGIPTRLLRGAINSIHYGAKGLTTRFVEVPVKNLHDRAESLLENKISSAEHDDRNFFTFTHQELEYLHSVGADRTFHHLQRKILDAERRQGMVHIPKKEVYGALHDLEKYGKTNRLNRYRAAAAIISLAASVLFLDQVRLTGFAIGTATGSYDYYSLFGFLFLALGILLLCMHRRR